MRIRISIFVASVAVLISGCASDSAKSLPQTPVDNDDHKPFVTKTAVFFPDSTGDFELYQKYAYPDAPDGVQLTYTSKLLPAATLDFFVFVLGRSPVDEAVKRGDQRMRGEVQAATKAGLYEDLQFVDDTDFQVTAADGKQLPGRRLRMTLDDHGRKMVSAGYMFYKQLYLVELRITAPAEAGDTLTQVGDDAARRIVPLIHMLNEGGCQNLEVNWDAKDPNSLLQGMQEAMDQAKSDGCTGVNGPQSQPAPDEHVMMLTYKPEDWQ